MKKQKSNTINTKLQSAFRLKLEEKFELFYKFKFHKDLLDKNLNNKPSKISSREWFKKNSKKRKIFLIKYFKKTVGLIIYNLDNFYYSIIILRKYRNLGIGNIVIKDFIKRLKKLKLNLRTIVSVDNKQSIKIHKNLSKNFRKYKKKYIKFFIL